MLKHRTNGFVVFSKSIFVSTVISMQNFSQYTLFWRALGFLNFLRVSDTPSDVGNEFVNQALVE